MKPRVTVADKVNRPSVTQFLLPNFCSGQTLLPVVLIAELLAFILATTQHSPGDELWAELGLVSLFLQWVALASAATLCATRRWLSRCSMPVGIAISYTLLLAVTAIVSECTYELVQVSGIAPDIAAHSRLAFLGRNLIVSAIIDALFLRYFYINNQWRRNLERDVRSRIEALQARIRPHFLFNSLNTIAALIRSQPKLAEHVIEDLADLFRASLGATGTVVSLANEVDLTRQYERIEMLRLGDRLTVHWHIEQLPDDAHVPQLMLQPVLENAIYHGIEPSPDGGVVTITGTHTERQLEIEIENPVGPARTGRRRGNHMALNNVRERLTLMYGSAASVTAYPCDERFRLVLRFPYNTTENP